MLGDLVKIKNKNKNKTTQHNTTQHNTIQYKVMWYGLYSIQYLLISINLSVGTFSTRPPPIDSFFK